MEQNDTLARHTVARPPLALVLIGGLALHGTLTAGAIIDRAAALGLGTDAQARAVLDLIDRRLASVSRAGSDGHLIAAPALEELPRAYRVRCIVAWLAQVRGARHV